jgi:type IV pilus assembly protein PilO
MMNFKLISEIFVARRKSFLCIIGLLVLNIVLLGYLSLYQKPRLAAEQNEWFKRRQAASNETLANAAETYSRGTLDLATWRGKILQKKDFAGFLNELFEASANSNLPLKAISYKPSLIKDENLISYVITFSVSGKYPAIKSFIADLGRMPHMVTVDTISLTNSSPTEESVDLRVQITTYLRMEGA